MLGAPEVKPRHKTAAGLGHSEGPILQGTIKSAAKHQSFIRGPYKIFKSQSQLAQDATKTHPRPIQRKTRLPPRCTQGISRRHAIGAPEVKPRHKTAAGLGHFEGPSLQGTIKSAAKHQSFIRGPYKIFKSQSQLAQDATKPHPRPIQGTTRLPPRCTQGISRRHARST